MFNRIPVDYLEVYLQISPQPEMQQALMLLTLDIPL